MKPQHFVVVVVVVVVIVVIAVIVMVVEIVVVVVEIVLVTVVVVVVVVVVVAVIFVIVGLKCKAPVTYLRVPIPRALYHSPTVAKPVVQFCSMTGSTSNVQLSYSTL
jgi:hypothetical protein